MRGPSPILITAALSIAVFIGAIGVHLGNTFTRTAPGAVQALEPVSPRAYLPDRGRGRQRKTRLARFAARIRHTRECDFHRLVNAG